MDLGVRQIRTAGKGSGSVELTLPGSLRRLVGRPCRIILHDGEQPDIILRPDLAAAAAAFNVVWRQVARCFAGDLAGRENEPFPASAFTFGLLPPAESGAAPYLCWQDGLSLAARDPDSMAAGRSVAACASQLGAELGIAPGLADGFGAACGFLVAGTLAGPLWQMPSDLAASELSNAATWRPGAAWMESPDIEADRFWSRLGPGLAACAALFAAWSLAGSAYPALCAAWRRGRSIELNRG